MKILLLFPPFFFPPELYPGIYYIKDFLRRHGYRDVKAIDLNLHFYDYVYTHNDEIVDRLDNRLSKTRKSADPLYGQRKQALDAALSARDDIGTALQYFRRREIKREDPLVSRRHMKALNSSMDAYAALGVFDFDESEERYSSESVMSRVSSDSFPYNDFYDHKFKRFGRSGSPDFVGISLTFEFQLMQAFATARWAKHLFPSAHVCLGGTAITKIIRNPRHRAWTVKNIFRFVDSVVLHEAEHSILELLEYVKGSRRRFTRQASILFPDREIKAERQSSYAELFTPDYNDIEYDKYFNMTFRGSRIKPIPFLVSRGCHWRRCRFCVSHYIYRGFRQCKDFNSLLDTISRYQDKYSFNYVRFNDEAVAPATIRTISGAMIDRRMKVRWVANMRADPTLDRDTCKLLYQAGCRKLLIGLESGSQRVVDSMMKGIRIDDVERALPILHDGGIATHLYIMCFYPGERLADLRKTYDFLKRNKRYIHSISVSPFDGETLAPVYKMLRKDDLTYPDARYDFLPIFYLKKRPTRKMWEVCSNMRKFRWDLIKRSYRD